MAIKPFQAKKKEEGEEISIGYNPNENTIHPHGSASASDGLNQLLYDITHRPKKVKWLIADINRPLELEKERKLLHIALIHNRMAASSEGIEELNEDSALVFKKRAGPLYSPQLGKWKEDALKCVETGLELDNLEYLKETDPCQVVVFNKDPMSINRLDLIKQLGGIPTYGIFNGRAFFATAGGQLSIARTTDFYNTQFELSNIHPEVLLNDPELKKRYEGKITYIFHENKMFLIEGSDFLTLQGPHTIDPKIAAKNKDFLKELFASPKDKEGNKIAGPKDVFEWQMEQFESLIYPFNSQNTKALADLFTSAATTTPSIADPNLLKTITKITGHKAHKEALPISYVETLESLGSVKKQILDHIATWKGEDQTIENISVYLKNFHQVYNYHVEEDLFYNDHRHIIRRDSKEQVSHLFFNSQRHKDLDPNHFLVPFKEPAIIKHIETMYEGHGAVIMKEAIKHFRKRGTVQGKSFGNYPELELILTEEELVNPEYTEQDLKQWEINPQYWPDLLKPVSLPKRYAELLKIFQTELKVTESGSLEVSDYRNFLNTTLFSDIFKSINRLRTKPSTRIEESIQTMLSDEDIVIKINRKLDSLYNLPLQKVTSHGIPKATDNVCAIIDSGFPPPKKANGENYTAEEMTELQTKHMLALIYRQHLKFPGDKLEVGFNEMGEQDEKLQIITNFVEVINTHLIAQENPGTEHAQAAKINYERTMLGVKLSVGDVLRRMNQNDARRVKLKNAEKLSKFPLNSSYQVGSDGMEVKQHSPEDKGEAAPLKTSTNTPLTEASYLPLTPFQVRLPFSFTLDLADPESPEETKSTPLEIEGENQTILLETIKEEADESIPSDSLGQAVDPQVRLHVRSSSPSPARNRFGHFQEISPTVRANTDPVPDTDPQGPAAPNPFSITP